MPRKRKRSKLALLDEVAGRNIPQEQLTSLLTSLRGFDLNDSFSRRCFGRHIREIIEPLKHTFILDLEGEREGFNWVVLHPGKLLQALIDKSPILMEAFAEAANKTEPSQDAPWSLLIGFDEFAPGNKLKVNNNRSPEEI